MQMGFLHLRPPCQIEIRALGGARTKAKAPRRRNLYAKIVSLELFQEYYFRSIVSIF